MNKFFIVSASWDESIIQEQDDGTEKSMITLAFVQRLVYTNSEKEAIKMVGNRYGYGYPAIRAFCVEAAIVELNQIVLYKDPVLLKTHFNTVKEVLLLKQKQ